jgi:hypothetical protein
MRNPSLTGNFLFNNNLKASNKQGYGVLAKIWRFGRKKKKRGGGGELAKIFIF